MFDNHPNPFIVGVPLAQWLNHLKLPVHIYSEQQILENISGFQAIFKCLYPKGRIFYAAKAQAAIPILEIMASQGLGADVASLNELRAALAAGVSPDNIGINGNAKEDALIDTAIANNIVLIADGMEEILLFKQRAKQQNRRALILLRASGFNLTEATQTSIRTGGFWCKFGTPIHEIPACIAKIRRIPEIELLGFHMHLGSQILDPLHYRLALGQLIECARLWISLGGLVKIVNLGGGFPVAYLDSKEWDRTKSKIILGFDTLKEGSRGLSHVFLDDAMGTDAASIDQAKALWTRNRAAPSFPKEKTLEAILNSTVMVEGEEISTRKALESIGEPALHIEPGRSLIEDAGLTLARVASVRRVAGEHALVNLEMGISSHIDSLVEHSIRRWQIINDPQRRDKEPFEAFVAGNLCFNADILARIKIPFQRRPIRGDIVAAMDTGAYCSNFLASTSNAFPRPDQILVKRSGEAIFLRKRDEDEEIIDPKASGSRLF